MQSPNWSDDEELLRDLREALTPVPLDDAALRTARMTFAWRTVDADLELARMFYDSCLEDGVLLRGTPSAGPRTLVFQGEHLGVELEVSDAGIEGQLVPPGPARVALMTAAGVSDTTMAEEDGYFIFSAVPRGSVRLECATGAARLVTEWITI